MNLLDEKKHLTTDGASSIWHLPTRGGFGDFPRIVVTLPTAASSEATHDLCADAFPIQLLRKGFVNSTDPGRSENSECKQCVYDKMLGRRSFPFGMVTFQGLCEKL